MPVFNFDSEPDSDEDFVFQPRQQQQQQQQQSYSSDEEASESSESESEEESEDEDEEAQIAAAGDDGDDFTRAKNPLFGPDATLTPSNRKQIEGYLVIESVEKARLAINQVELDIKETPTFLEAKGMFFPGIDVLDEDHVRPAQRGANDASLAAPRIKNILN
ncbi:hypothetical protein TL16_g03528 [Triparma laevis f. inornata]|uniref:Uncharacterized protein n=1 Tax=Triparma laevis f. inornata TaxID=1714386 RepID=A0A9W7E519_9STRA|nr:hypothetical protein TL16_g03528 [Triparma laevis f. inornata]